MINMEIPQLMSEQYRQAREIIENSDDIKIYSHIDCDGICSGAILSTILDRQNKEHDIDFVNLDVLDDIDLDHELTIFSDLGSGQRIDTKAKANQKIIILDHHPPLRDLDYANDKDYTYLEINPIHHGISHRIAYHCSVSHSIICPCFCFFISDLSLWRCFVVTYNYYRYIKTS